MKVSRSMLNPNSRAAERFTADLTFGCCYSAVKSASEMRCLANTLMVGCQQRLDSSRAPNTRLGHVTISLTYGCPPEHSNFLIASRRECRRWFFIRRANSSRWVAPFRPVAASSPNDSFRYCRQYPRWRRLLSPWQWKWRERVNPCGTRRVVRGAESRNCRVQCLDMWCDSDCVEVNRCSARTSSSKCATLRVPSPVAALPPRSCRQGHSQKILSRRLNEENWKRERRQYEIK